VAGAAATLHYFADIAVDIGGEVIPAPYSDVMDYTIHEPIGVVGAIIPWNFPILTAARKLGSALAAGNTVVIKPSSWAPLSTLLLAECLQEAGLPDGVVNVIPSAGEDVQAVFTKAGPIEEVSFTGSTKVGGILYGACTSALKGCTLELGGKSPGLVLPDCNMDETVAGTLFGVYLNQGECCCALTRLIVHEDVYDEFTERFIEGSKAIKIGMPRDEDCRLGPMIHPDHLKSVMNYIEAGKKEGAKLLCGGNTLTAGDFGKGNFMEPTVLGNVKSSMKVWQEEIFGPVVVVAKAGSLDEMVEMANDSSYGLAASVWTTDLKTAHTIAPKIEAGTVWFNLHNFVFPCGPYGGYKSSGLGRELGREGVMALTRTKNVMVSLFPGGFKWY
jgi:acyl-CoA reductase-like NAD-dependent aldehyde dehydrogenase